MHRLPFLLHPRFVFHDGLTSLGHFDNLTNSDMSFPMNISSQYVWRSHDGVFVNKDCESLTQFNDQFDMSSPFPFKPCKLQKEGPSSYPKMVLNRSYVSTKWGLEISEFHENRAFRIGAKWRVLKKLYNSNDWQKMNNVLEEKVMVKLK